jgi:hypothetical protein
MSLDRLLRSAPVISVRAFAAMGAFPRLRVT